MSGNWWSNLLSHSFVLFLELIAFQIFITKLLMVDWSNFSDTSKRNSLLSLKACMLMYKSIQFLLFCLEIVRNTHFWTHPESDLAAAGAVE